MRLDRSVGDRRHVDRRLAAAGIAVLALLPFLGTLGHDLLPLDDRTYLSDNPHLRAGLSLRGMSWAATTFYFNNWHPLTWLSYLLDWELHGLHPAGVRLGNLLLHAVGAALLFLALERLTGRRGPAAAVAALWAVHPLRVESVVWLAERKDVLSGALFFLTLWLWAGWARRGGRGRYLASLGAFAAGLTAKGMLITLPALLLVLDFWPLRRLPGDSEATPRGWRGLLVEKVPFLILAAITAGLTLAAQRVGRDLPDVTAHPVATRLAIALAAVAAYAADTVWPAGLAVIYPLPAAIPWPAAVAGGGLVAALVGLGWWQRRRRPWWLAGGLWYLGMLVPVLGLVSFSVAARADRYTYLPGIGLLIVLVWGAAELLARRRATRPLAVPAVVVAVLALGAAAVAYAEVWRDGTTLFRHTLATAGPSALAHSNLGNALLRRGDVAAAAEQYRRSLARDPTSARVHNNLGLARRRLGDTEGAIAAFEAALEREPGLAGPHLNLAALHDDLGRPERALDHLAAALVREPENRAARLGLRDLLSRLPREEAHRILAARAAADGPSPVLDQLVAALGRLGPSSDPAPRPAPAPAGLVSPLPPESR